MGMAAAAILVMVMMIVCAVMMRVSGMSVRHHRSRRIREKTSPDIRT
jgi:hypothetical protein